jgi:pimeloyl-ACP methyl ester carboxylesterase
MRLPTSCDLCRLRRIVKPQVILLPGGVMPAEFAYSALLETLGDEVDAVAKELEIYAGAAPPPGYTLQTEIDGILRVAQTAAFDRFHLVGYSGGGASSLAFAAAYPDRLLSLALIEPAWMGNDELSPEEQAIWREFERIATLPPDQMMVRSPTGRVAIQGGGGPGGGGGGATPGASWMATNAAFITTFRSSSLDLNRLRAFTQPVLFALGGRSNPDYYGRMAVRAGAIFPNLTVTLFEQRHHFDPPHRIEPDRTARVLRAHWAQVGEG